MKVKCFEDLECSPEARRLTRSIYDCAKRPRFAKDFKMDQGYISEKNFQQNYPPCAKIRKMINGLIRYLKQHKNDSRQTDKPAQPAKTAKNAENPVSLLTI